MFNILNICRTFHHYLLWWTRYETCRKLFFLRVFFFFHYSTFIFLTFVRSLPLELGLELGLEWSFIIFFFSPAGCQGCDWIFVIWSDYHASADSLCPPHGWINGVISLTDSLCVQCRQIGQLVPRWQLYRYGGDWRGAQGRAADSSWCLLEVPSLHWSSHVPEV